MRPIIGVIGNQHLINDQYNVQASGTMNCDALVNVAGCMPLIIPSNPQHVSVEELQACFDGFVFTGARANAERAGVAEWTSFACQPLSALEQPTKQKGLVILNPPYGARIGNRKLLFGLYGAIGAVMRERFTGWHFGMVTSDEGLAKATGLTWSEVSRPVAFGGLTVKLYQSAL